MAGGAPSAVREKARLVGEDLKREIAGQSVGSHVPKVAVVQLESAYVQPVGVHRLELR
jgi:hypothetical protein